MWSKCQDDSRQKRNKIKDFRLYIATLDIKSRERRSTSFWMTRSNSTDTNVKQSLTDPAHRGLCQLEVQRKCIKDHIIF